MLDRIAIGTANFTMPYGILNEGKCMDVNVVHELIASALAHGINTFDTALAYGDLFSVLPTLQHNSDLNIITKFSVKDDYAQVRQQIENSLAQRDLQSIYGLLLHDPHNLHDSDYSSLRDFLQEIISSQIVNKVGVSVYAIDDVYRFADVIQPNIVQIPLNPLNQKFIDHKFKNYIQQHDIEIHARSLFMQGLLLSEVLPHKLSALEDIWADFKLSCEKYNSRLQAILTWANDQTWVNKWIMGVASTENLQQIIKNYQEMDGKKKANIFAKFKDIEHPLLDPRNWQ